MTEESKDLKIKIDSLQLFLLFLLFLGLKLGGVINWSWWWVFSPFWLPPLFVLGLLAVVLLMPLICAAATAGFIFLKDKLKGATNDTK